MKLTLLPLQHDDLIRVRCEGTLAGEADGGDALEALLGPRCYTHKVLLDVAGAPTVTTSGIGWLLGVNRRFSQDGGRLVLHGVMPQVMDVLKFACVAPQLLLASGEARATELARGAAPSVNGPAPGR